MHNLTKLSLLLPLTLVSTLAQHASASTDVDHIEFIDNQLELTELTTATVDLDVFNADYCNPAVPGHPSNCGSSVSLSFDTLSPGLHACFLDADNECRATASVGVGPIGIVVESTAGGPTVGTVRVRGRFNNFDLSSSTATLHVTVVPPAFLTGPSSTRLVRGTTATLGFAARHPASGAATTVAFDGQPSGLTLTASPAIVPVGVVQASVAVVAAATLAAGTYVVDVIAAVPGFVAQVEPLTVVVVDPIDFKLVRLPGQTFGIRIDTSPVAILVNVTRQPGVTRAIAYSTPARNFELDVAVRANSDGSSVRLIVTRGALAAPGPTTITLRGEVNGVTTSVVIPVTIL